MFWKVYLYQFLLDLTFLQFRIFVCQIYMTAVVLGPVIKSSFLITKNGIGSHGISKIQAWMHKNEPINRWMYGLLKSAALSVCSRLHPFLQC